MQPLLRADREPGQTEAMELAGGDPAAQDYEGKSDTAGHAGLIGTAEPKL
jgi:hypothetical protein